MDKFKKEINPKLYELITHLKISYQRDQFTLRTGREKFLGEVDSLSRLSPGNAKSNSKSSLSRLLNYWNQIWQSKPFRIALTFSILVFVFAASIVSASQNALPGESLYGIKLNLENSRLSVVSDRTNELSLHLEFAQNRYDEISYLAANHKLSGVSLDRSVNNFESHLQAAGELTIFFEEDQAGQAQETISRLKTAFEVLISTPSGGGTKTTPTPTPSSNNEGGSTGSSKEIETPQAVEPTGEESGQENCPVSEQGDSEAEGASSENATPSATQAPNFNATPVGNCIEQTEQPTQEIESNSSGEEDEEDEEDDGNEGNEGNEGGEDGG